MRPRRDRTESAHREPNASRGFAESRLATEARLLTLIDAALTGFAGRNSVAVSEVADTLLDLRAQILFDSTLAELLGAEQ